MHLGYKKHYAARQLKLIEDNNISGVILISGDRHGARGFYIQRPSGFKLYEFEAASLGARVGPAAKDESWTSQLYGIDAKFAFGELTFETSVKDPEEHSTNSRSRTNTRS